MVFFTIGLTSHAQILSTPSTNTVPGVGITMTPQGNNTYQFNAATYIQNYLVQTSTSSLYNINNFKYYWSFGDGHTSTLMNPTHAYEGDAAPGTYKVMFIGTPIYIPLPPPPAGTIDLVKGPLTFQTYPPTLMGDVNIKVAINREPMVDEESTVEVTYKNGSVIPAFVHINFELNTTYFDLINVFTFEGDDFIQEDFGTSNCSSPNYNRILSFKSGNPLFPQEERKILFQVRTKPEVLGEAILTTNPNEITPSPSLFFKALTDAGQVLATLDEDELQTQAVGSWDPNMKLVSHPFLLNNSISVSSAPTLRYRIHFENEGTASTNTVEITDYIHPLLDMTTINNINYKNDTGIRAVDIEIIPDRKIVFGISNFPLAGANDPNIGNMDDSKYWIEYDITVDYDAWNNYVGSLPYSYPGTEAFNFGTDASIIFDSHIPIITNVATTSVINPVVPIVLINSISPNPVNSSTSISYTLSESITAQNSYFYAINLNNGIHTILSNTIMGSPGTYSTNINISTLPSGVYSLILYTPVGISGAIPFVKL